MEATGPDQTSVVPLEGMSCAEERLPPVDSVTLGRVIVPLLKQKGWQTRAAVGKLETGVRIYLPGWAKRKKEARDGHESFNTYNNNEPNIELVKYVLKHDILTRDEIWPPKINEPLTPPIEQPSTAIKHEDSAPKRAYKKKKKATTKVVHKKKKVSSDHQGHKVKRKVGRPPKRRPFAQPQHQELCETIAAAINITGMDACLEYGLQLLRNAQVHMLKFVAAVRRRGKSAQAASIEQTEEIKRLAADIQEAQYETSGAIKEVVRLATSRATFTIPTPVWDLPIESFSSEGVGTIALLTNVKLHLLRLETEMHRHHRLLFERSSVGNARFLSQVLQRTEQLSKLDNLIKAVTGHQEDLRSVVDKIANGEVNSTVDVSTSHVGELQEQAQGSNIPPSISDYSDEQINTIVRAKADDMLRSLTVD